MNVKYYYEFKGLDKVLNRVEILTSDSVEATEVTATADPFVIEYPSVKKLEVVQGSGATLNLVSKQIFQFTDLHIDDMQGYLVKYYRASKLFWIGWLDPELYEENLSSYPPYPVQFTASDFNVLDRIKYQDESGKQYTDIVSLFDHLKRCLKLLNLPFERLFIGCTTSSWGSTGSSDTVLHSNHVQSLNFYDEDGKPMSCREVIKSILEPFGLMMIQRDANVYIYDYNTVSGGLKMKQYNFNTFNYINTIDVSFQLGDLQNIGFMSSDASYNFEDMINNVSITSSRYIDVDLFAGKTISEQTLKDKTNTKDFGSYTLDTYRSSEGWQGGTFELYKEKYGNKTLAGAKIGLSSSLPVILLLDNMRNYIAGTENGQYYINIIAEAYAGTTENPFEEKDEAENENAKIIEVFGNLVLYDASGNALKYYHNADTTTPREWSTVPASGVPENQFALRYGNTTDKPIVNDWIANSRMEMDYLSTTLSVTEKDFQKGAFIFPPREGGYIGLSLRYAIVSDKGYQDSQVIIAENITRVLINNLSISITDIEGESAPSDDIEFKSYINKNVATDYEDMTLKCVTAAEEEIPVGKGYMMKRVLGSYYTLNTEYTRAGQTDILERLLLCTIHSNYSQKNKLISVTVKITDNPMMRYALYASQFGNYRFLITGCILDFNNNKCTINAVGFSEDTYKLSDIPYE